MTAPRPFTLIAELTHRCPLHCPYCSNPVALARDELDTATWQRVLGEAEALGVVQLHLTGGEPLLRDGLEVLVARGHALGLYTNLITSGVPLARDRLAALRAAGLDHVQLSVQHAEAGRADAIAGARVFERKLAVAGWIRGEGLAFTLNVVLHRGNIDAVDALVALAERLGAERLELANATYLGFAHANRAALLPSRDQIERAYDRALAAKQRLAGTLDVVFVRPDHFTGTPRACMDGWARRYIHITPAGRVLPCHAAECIPGLAFDRVTERPLAAIWEHSTALAAFRGNDWMREPCRSCERRELDLGGCRCQAYMLAGDAASADPACARSPHHARVAEAARDDLHALGRRSPR